MLTSKDGTKLAVDSTGTGPAVVCVGGALNDRHSTPGELPGFTVYSYDRRGRGNSGDTHPYAVAREIEDLTTVIEATGGQAMVYGMSSGAVLALRAALSGAPITRLALYEPPFTVTTTPPTLPNYATRLSEAIESNRPGDALELFMTGKVGIPPEAVAGMRETPMWPALESLAPTLRYDDAVMAEGKIPPVANLTTPVAVLAGAASPPWMREAAETLARTLPKATYTELPDQTHNVDPTALAEALTSAFA